MSKVKCRTGAWDTKRKVGWVGMSFCKDIAVRFPTGCSAIDGLLGPPRLHQRDNSNVGTDLSRSQLAWWTTELQHHSTQWGSQTRLWRRHTLFPTQPCCYGHSHPIFLDVQTLFKLWESGLRFVKTHTLTISSSDPQLANYKLFFFFFFGRLFGQNNECSFSCLLSPTPQVFWKHVPYPGLTG